jgi:hypothetical protein
MITLKSPQIIEKRAHPIIKVWAQSDSKYLLVFAVASICSAARSLSP